MTTVKISRTIAAMPAMILAVIVTGVVAITDSYRGDCGSCNVILIAIAVDDDVGLTALVIVPLLAPSLRKSMLSRTFSLPPLNKQTWLAHGKSDLQPQPSAINKIQQMSCAGGKSCASGRSPPASRKDMCSFGAALSKQELHQSAAFSIAALTSVLRRSSQMP